MAHGRHTVSTSEYARKLGLIYILHLFQNTSRPLLPLYMTRLIIFKGRTLVSENNIGCNRRINEATNIPKIKVKGTGGEEDNYKAL